MLWCDTSLEKCEVRKSACLFCSRFCAGKSAREKECVCSVVCLSVVCVCVCVCL